MTLARQAVGSLVHGSAIALLCAGPNTPAPSGAAPPSPPQATPTQQAEAPPPPPAAAPAPAPAAPPAPPPPPPVMPFDEAVLSAANNLLGKAQLPAEPPAEK